jgi:hypothetical protein
MATTFGEVSWSDDSVYGGNDKKSQGKDSWMRLEEGKNVVRLLTQPYQYLVHKGIKREGDKGYGQKVFCSAIHGHCPLCSMGLKASARWYLGVLDRKSNSYKILDISYQVFSGIRKLAQDTDVWGDPSKYDVNIVVDKNGGASGYYTVQPIPHKPLTPEAQLIRDKVDLDELKRKVSPPTPGEAQKRLDKILEGGTLAMPQAPAGKAGASATPKVQSPPPVEMNSDDDASDMFPDYEQQA